MTTQAKPPEYSHDLRLTVKDHGVRTFIGSDNHESQDDLCQGLAYDIKRMLSILNDAPSAANLAAAMEDPDSLIGLIGYLDSHWTGDSNFEDAFHLVVDLDVLMPSADDGERESAAQWIKRAGFAVKDAAPDKEEPKP